jgi:hypothetical protein
MSEDRPDVVLGWGYGPTDLTSPALAAKAGALADTSMTSERVTELRIHGVAGSDSSVMLEHPTALQVAGDDVTGFFRRWIPDGPGRLSVPWKLEAYCWRGRTAVRVALTWLLLAPFMVYNAAYFMLPPSVPGDTPVVPEPVPPLRPGRGHRTADALLRLLALAATVQFVSSVTTVTVSTVARQAAGRHGMLPSWMGWYGSWTVGWRVAGALCSVAVVVGGLWWISAVTTAGYESRTSSSLIDPHPRWPLTQPGFWEGRTLASRQRALHCAAALAASALIVMLPAGHHPAAAWWVVRVLAGAVLLAAAASVIAPMAGRHWVTLAYGGRPPGGGADEWCRGVLSAALSTLVMAALVSGWSDQRRGPQPGALPGLNAFLAGLLVVQVTLLVALAVTVVRQAGRARAAGCYREVPPFLRGWLAPLVALTGVVLGGILAALINLGVTRFLGAPVPSGFAYAPMPANALAVPWPIVFFGVALMIGLISGALIAQVPFYRRWRDHRDRFLSTADGAPSPVAAFYQDRTAGSAGATDGDGPAYARNREAIAGAWAMARPTAEAGAAAAWVIGAATAVALLILLFAAAIVGPPGRPTVLSSWWQGLGGLVGLLVIFAVVRREKFALESRRRIRALWEMVTFWPRAVHPLTPPSYAGRAVPEIVDRIRLLTGHIGETPYDAPPLQAEAGLARLERVGRATVPAGPVLLSGYSYGSVIASAVIAQLPQWVRGDVALLTLACPMRRLYGRAFPAYFGGDQLAALAELLDADERGGVDGRWKNLCRRSDYLGSWVFHDPEPRSDRAYLADHVDQPCWDPVFLVPDTNPAPPPTRRYAGFWSDPRTSELGEYLVRLLERRVIADADGTVGLSEAQQHGGSASGSQRDCGGVTGSSGTAGAAGSNPR